MKFAVLDTLFSIVTFQNTICGAAISARWLKCMSRTDSR